MVMFFQIFFGILWMLAIYAVAVAAMETWDSPGPVVSVSLLVLAAAMFAGMMVVVLPGGGTARSEASRRCVVGGTPTGDTPMSAWQPIETAPEHMLVMTKLDDGHGSRLQQPLRRDGRLWWLPDGSMYVYYTPTHWKPTPREEPRG